MSNRGPSSPEPGPPHAQGLSGVLMHLKAEEDPAVAAGPTLVVTHLLPGNVGLSSLQMTNVLVPLPFEKQSYP